MFRQIALSLSERALSAALAPLESGLAGGISQLVGGLTTGLTTGLTSGLASTLATGFAGAGPVRAFAKGGVVASPTYFPLGGGAGLMGEAGAEAILPLARDASGRLGVAAGGEGAGAPAIVFNVQARDAESFARSETQIATMVARRRRTGTARALTSGLKRRGSGTGATVSGKPEKPVRRRRASPRSGP